MAPPEGAAPSVKTYPAPLPPTAVNWTVPRGGTVGACGLSPTPLPTTMFTAPTLPNESVTVTTSSTLETGPATYTPLEGSTTPPEPLVVRAKTSPAPLPPLATKVSVPPGGTTGALGVMAMPAPTAIWRVAKLPRLSVATSMSAVLPIAPAV